MRAWNRKRPFDDVIFQRHVCSVTQARGQVESYVTKCEDLCCREPEYEFIVKEHTVETCLWLYRAVSAGFYPDRPLRQGECL